MEAAPLVTNLPSSLKYEKNLTPLVAVLYENEKKSKPLGFYSTLFYLSLFFCRFVALFVLELELDIPTRTQLSSVSCRLIALGESCRRRRSINCSSQLVL